MSNYTFFPAYLTTNLTPLTNNQPYRILLPFVQWHPQNLAFPDFAFSGYEEETRSRYFTDAQDATLIRLMEGRNGRMTASEWAEVARLVDPTFSVRRVQDRWNNFLRPPLDRSEFTPEERRSVARLMFQQPNDWRWIAEQLSPEKTRSAAMVKHLGANLRSKIHNAGFQIDQIEDIDLLPDEVFQLGFPKGPHARVLVQMYCERKAAAARRADLEQMAFHISIAGMLAGNGKRTPK
jgi:hypothetical protein